jgi:hypothetical protein
MPNTAGTNTPPPLAAQQGSSKRLASQLSGGASDDRGGQQADDRGQQADDNNGTAAAVNNVATTASTKDRSKRAKIKNDAVCEFLAANYKNRDDIVILAKELPLIKCGAGAEDKTRLVSICGKPIKELTLKSLRLVFLKEEMGAFGSKTKKEVCETIVAHKINTTVYSGKRKIVKRKIVNIVLWIYAFRSTLC